MVAAAEQAGAGGGRIRRRGRGRTEGGREGSGGSGLVLPVRRSVGRSPSLRDLRCPLFLSFALPLLGRRTDGMTKRRVENPVCANGLKGRPACGTLHVQIMGHVASMRCQRQGLSSLPRPVAPSTPTITRGWRGEGRWRMAPILIGRSLFFALCSRARS